MRPYGAQKEADKKVGQFDANVSPKPTASLRPCFAWVNRYSHGFCRHPGRPGSLPLSPLALCGWDGPVGCIPGVSHAKSKLER